MRRVCRILAARCRAYVAQGLSLTEIAQREGWHEHTIGMHVTGLGMTTRRPPRIGPADILSVAWGIETVGEVAQRREVSRAAVHKAAGKMGLRVGRGHERIA